MRGHSVDPKHALDVPAEVVPVELDLEVGEAVIADPLGQRLGKPVAHALRDVGLDNRIGRSDRMVHGEARLRLLEHVPVEDFALEVGPQVRREIARHEVAPVSVIAIQAVSLAEGVVQGDVERAGGDQRAELGDRLRQPQLTRDLGRGFDVCGLERGMDVDRVARSLVIGSDRPDATGQRLHCPERDVIRQGRERPDVAERHRPEALGRTSSASGSCRAHGAVNVQDRGAVNFVPAELVRPAIAVVFKAARDVVNPDVRGSRRHRIDLARASARNQSQGL